MANEPTRADVLRLYDDLIYAPFPADLMHHMKPESFAALNWLVKQGVVEKVTGMYRVVSALPFAAVPVLIAQVETAPAVAPPPKAVKLTKAQWNALRAYASGQLMAPSVANVWFRTAQSLAGKGLLANNGLDSFRITPAGRAALGSE